MDSLSSEAASFLACSATGAAIGAGAMFIATLPAASAIERRWRWADDSLQRLKTRRNSASLSKGLSVLREAAKAPGSTQPADAAATVVKA